MEQENGGFLGDQKVSSRAYAYHESQMDKLVKERDRAQDRLDLYRSLFFCLLGIVLTAILLSLFKK